jgi:uncharacterized membrane protein (DUF4010 family)
MGPGEFITVLLTAAGLGAVVGLERQVADDDAAAGARSFALYALWGTASGYFGEEFGAGGFAVGAATFGAVVVAFYVIGAVRGAAGWGTTTEVASLATFFVGVLVWGDQVVAAVALTVGLAALLKAKDTLHRIADRFSDEDVRAVLQFGVLTAIVLPLVPDEAYGPFEAFNPRETWLMVVFVAGIGLLGYIAHRVLGTRGLALGGAVGGLVSSTAVSMGFSRMSRSRPGLLSALAAGILAACGLMYPRVLVEASVVAPDMGSELVWWLLGLFGIVLVVALWWWFRPTEALDGEGVDVTNPLTLSSALTFGALYALIVFASKALLDRASEASLSVVGAVSGINDVDAITLSTANLVRDTSLDPRVGARVVLIAVTVNTLVKAGMVAVLGTRRLAVAVGVGLVPAAAAGLAAWLLI